MRLRRLAGDRRWAGCGEFVEAPPHVRPAEGKHGAALVCEHTIAAIAVDLQDSTKAGKMGNRPLGLSVRRINIGDARWVVSLPGPVIAGVGS